MRSLTEKLRNRLSAQTQEARNQGLTKVAKHLQSVISNNEVRDDNAGYTYASQDFQDNVENYLWLSVARALDFYDSHLDAAEMQPIVEKLAHALIEEVRIKSGIDHGVGAYEPNVPGERRETVAIELSDE